jgi:DNA-binding protein H-NS
LWSVALLDEDLNRHSPSIVAENSITGPKLSSAIDLASMSVDELWKLHEMVEAILAKKIAAEIIVLRRHLDRLSPEANAVQREARKPSKAVKVERRLYPPVLPKYRNPTQPSETWAGRGKQPRWVKMQLSLGTRLEDMEIR